MAASAAPPLVASPHVVAYWREGRFIIHHVPTDTRRHADPLAAYILQFFQTPRTQAALVAAFAAGYGKVLRQTVAELVRLGFLHRADRKPPARERALQDWGAWNPSVSFFHFSTRDRPWAKGVRRDVAESAFRHKAEDGGMPPEPVKRLGTTPAVRLPRHPRSGEFTDVLLARRTWRGFGRRPLKLAALAELLQLTWGVQRWGEAGVDDRVAFKTSPSGGGRTALEAYVLALRVDGLARGLYHYVADDHTLEHVRAGASPSQVEDYLGGQWFFRPAAALVLMTAVVARMRWRYPHPESYASLLLEAGHFCQTFCLVATWLELAPFCTVALANSRIERDLGIDGVSEVLLYAAGVGTRPADGRWVQWPRHLPGHPYLPPDWKPSGTRSAGTAPARAPRTKAR